MANFRRTLLLAGMVTVAVSGNWGSALRAQTFCRTYERLGLDTPWTTTASVTAAPGGGYVVTGAMRIDSEWAAWGMGIDEDGEISWQMGYTGATGLHLESGAATADGGAVMAGEFSEGLGVIKVDSAGALEWQIAFGNDDSQSASVVEAVQEASDGNYFVVAHVWTQGTGYRKAWIAKLNSEGALLWQKFYRDSDRFDSIESATATSTGGLRLTGNILCDAGKQCGLLAELDDAGVPLWARSYDLEFVAHHLNLATVRTTDGGYAISGVTPSRGRAYAIKTDASGEVLWTREMYSQGGRAFDLVEQSDEGIVLALGFGNNASRPLDVIKFDVLGETVWTNQFGVCGKHQAFEMELTPDDGLIIAGAARFKTAQYQTASDAWVLRLSAEGEIEANCPYVTDDPPTITTVSATSAGRTLVPTPASQTTIEWSVTTIPLEFRPFEACGSGLTLRLPAEISAPDSPVPLHFVDPVSLIWEDNPQSRAERFHLYRSDGPGYAHVCLQPDLTPNQTIDLDEPDPGALFTYLVSGVNDEGEGPLGRGLHRAPRGELCDVERRALTYCP